jgi:outer membrane lipoprotein-sorting protein
MLTAALFLALSNGQQVDAQEVANRYLRQLKNASAISGVFSLSLGGAAIGTGEANFAINREGQFRVSTSGSEEIFDGRYKFVRDITKMTYQVFDSRSVGFPLLTPFEPIVQSKSISDRTAPIFTGTGSPVVTDFDGASSVQMAFGDTRRYINPATGLPSGFTLNANGVQYKGVFKQVNLEPRLSNNTFVFEPKPGERQVPVVTPGLAKIGAQLAGANDKPLAGSFSNTILTVVVYTRASQTVSNDAMIALGSLARKSRPRLNVIAINSENQSPSQYFRGRKTPISTITDTANLTQAAGVTQFPTMIVVDRDGRIVHAEAAGMEGTLKSVLQSNGYTF